MHGAIVCKPAPGITEPSLVYTGSWFTNNSSVHSGASARMAVDAGARLMYSFSGTAVKWIGYRDPYSGIAHVFIDGVMQQRIDTYSAATAAQTTIFTAQNLPAGPHVLIIEVRGEKNPSSGGAWIWIDALETAAGG